MTKNTKIALGIAVAGAVGYWIYSRNKAKKSLNPFSNFASADGTSSYYHGKGKNYRIVVPANVTPAMLSTFNNDLDAIWRSSRYMLNDGYYCNQYAGSLPCNPKQPKRNFKVGTPFIGGDIEVGTFYNPSWNTKLKMGVVKVLGRGQYYIPADWIVEVK
jgi:hypothetical protein